jgi:hypothetical protein
MREMCANLRPKMAEKGNCSFRYILLPLRSDRSLYTVIDWIKGIAASAIFCSPWDRIDHYIATVIDCLLEKQLQSKYLAQVTMTYVQVGAIWKYAWEITFKAYVLFNSSGYSDTA